MKRRDSAGLGFRLRCAELLSLAALGALGLYPDPAAAEETVFADDFESPPNPRTLMPWHWEQVFDAEPAQDPSNLPRYNVALQLADRAPHGGRSAVVFRTLGAATALRLSTPVAVHAGRAYALSAWGRGEGLESNRLLVELEWLDARGQTLGSDASDAVPASAPWVRLEVAVQTPPAKAVAVRPLLRLEGPDVRGEAWFDDVELRAHVHLAIDSGPHPGNLFRVGEPVSYTLILHGADAGTYEVHRTVVTLDGNIVLPRVRLARIAETAGTLLIPDQFDLPHAGYMEAEVQVRRDGLIVAERVVPLGVLEDFGAVPSPGDFGAVLDPAPAGIPPPRVHLEKLLAEAGMRRVKMPLPPIGVRDDALDDLTRLVAHRFASNRFELIGMLQVSAAESDPTATAAERTLCARLRSDKLAWWTSLRDVLQRYRSDLKAFQLGLDDERCLAAASDLDVLLAQARQTIEGELTFATVGLPVPWPAPERAGLAQPPYFYAVYAGAASATEPAPAWLLAASSPRSVAERRLTLRTRTLSESSGPPPTGAPLPGAVGTGVARDRASVTRGPRASATRAQLADLGQRAVETRRYGWETVYLGPLYGPPSALLDTEGFPTPAFHAWRTINALLSGTVYDGTAFAFAEVESRRFHRGNTTVVALWAPRGPTRRNFWLGDGVRVADLTGGVQPLPNGEALTLGPEPVFLLGVNPSLLVTQRAIAVEPAVLDLREHEQTLLLTLRNEFPDAIQDVRISRIRDAEGTWSITPSERRLALLAPGKTFEIPLTVRLPIQEAPGIRDLTAEVHFVADKPYTTVVSRPIEVVSPLDLTLELTPASAREPTRVKVAARNRREPTGKPEDDASRALRFRLTTTLPGAAPTDRYFDLPPGGSIPDIHLPIRGAVGRVMAVLHEIDGDHFLTRSVDIQ